MVGGWSMNVKLSERGVVGQMFMLKKYLNFVQKKGNLVISFEPLKIFRTKQSVTSDFHCHTP